MLMYSQMNKTIECDECHNVLNNRLIAISYGNRCLCNFCYKKKLFYEGKNKQGTMVAELDMEDCERIAKQILDRSFFVERFEFAKKKATLLPKEVVAYLDRNVIGQEAAKKALAVAVCNHKRRIDEAEDTVMIPKSNILIQGPTGCGKTYILRMLAELLDVPFYIADASNITEASYKGNNVDTVITGLYQAAEGDIEKTEKGIIFLDEFDKLSMGFRYDGITSVGANVQRQMLKMIEGCTMNIQKIGSRKNGETVSINTKNILFICGGAFVGINDVKEIEMSHRIGFLAEQRGESAKTSVKDTLSPEDFINYGLIPEIVGRLPIIVSLTDLSEKNLADVLCNTENSLVEKYKSLFKEAYNVELVFDKAAIDEIAHQAYIRHTGARGLDAIVEKVMQDPLFEVPSDPTIRRCVIKRDVVLGIKKARYLYDNDTIKRRAS